MSEGSGAGEPSVKRLRVAYLGPAGTYGHQAAKLFIASLGEEATGAEMIPCPTIPEIYTHPSDYLVMPLQNVIQGGVNETVDSLLSPIAGPSTARQLAQPRIIADLDLPIRHSLVARRGTRLEDVRWVRSHEQALGQSSAFLAERLPWAKQEPWASTAGAAMSLLNPETEGAAETGAGAAICSASAVLDYPELEVLYEGTQAINDNFTRFLLLSRRPPSPDETPLHPQNSPASYFYALGHPFQLSYIPRDAIRSIHTRPHPSLTSPGNQYPQLLLVETDQPAFSSETLVDIVHLGSAVPAVGSQVEKP